MEGAMNSRNLPVSSLEGGWTIGVGWSRKVVILASVLNILALLLIVFSIVNFTPFSLLASVSIGGALMGAAILLYVVVVFADLKRRGVL
jgi:hypothetical protein